MSFAIVGAGVVGLTTALQLQNEFPNAKVSIFADKFNEETTSYVAAGIFRPGLDFTGPTLEITKKWISDSFEYWNNIRKSRDAVLAGVCELSGYKFSKISAAHVKNHLLEDILPIYRRATNEELSLCNGGWKYGSFFTTVLTETKLYLPFATQKFKNAGGVLHNRKIDSFEHFGKDYDVVINCTGLGAKELVTDHLLVPIRGQVIKVKAPWIKLAFYGDFDTYIIPGFEGVTLGGCRQYDNYNKEICKYDSASIRERCFAMLPSLKKANVLREAVGLRPHRTPVRIEPEILQLSSGKRLKIVHNYGHGGFGVTTAPGTAMYAVKIVRDVLSSNSSKL